MTKNKSLNDSYEKKFGFDIKLNSDEKIKSSGLEKTKPKSKDEKEKEKVNTQKP